MILRNAMVLNDQFQFEKCNVEIRSGVFSSFFHEDTAEGTDLSGCILVPGLIDIHAHGAAGGQASDLQKDGIVTMAEYMLRSGSTAFAATFPSLSQEHTKHAIGNILDYIHDGEKHSRIAGIHMEGPYFSYARKGGQDNTVFRDPSVEEFKELNVLSGGLIKNISLAPERNGAMDFIRQISNDAVVSIGHTDCDYDTAMQAIEMGATNITHTFNAMRGYAHRAPNVIGAAFDSNVTCECISDGYHLHPNAVRLLYKMVGSDRLILISDSVVSAGLPDGEYISANKTIYVRDGKTSMADGTIAGGCTPLLGCVRKAIEFGIPAEDAFKCASRNPARLMGIDNRLGSIAVGKLADFLVLDESFNLLRVYKNGERML